jgi:hypothetical protein
VATGKSRSLAAQVKGGAYDDSARYGSIGSSKGGGYQRWLKLNSRFSDHYGLISIGMEERGVRTPGFDEPPRSGGEGRRRALAPTVPSDQRGMSGAAANNPSLSARSIACARFKCERKHVVRKFAIG